jgi:hypothetical protein
MLMGAAAGENRVAAETRAWKLPLEVFDPGTDPLSPQQAARWTLVFLVLGTIARVARFALRFPFWYDEAALSANFLERGYLDMLRPLEGGPTCPIGFLWVQLTLVKLLGFSEFSLRLFPLACGLASLWLMRHVALRLFRGTAAAIAVGVLAASYPAVRYAAEGKPYGSDLLLGLAMTALAIEWLRRPDRRRWLWLMAGLTPAAVAISFPVVFVAGAASAVVAFALWKRRGTPGSSVGHWTAWLAMNVLLLCTFAGSVAATRANLTQRELERTEDYWRDAFPPLDWPVGLAKWLAEAHTGELLAHPFGGKHGASTLTALACLTAIVVLCQFRQFALLTLLAGPAVLNLVAAAMHRYPYGGHIRLAMYLGSAVCLMAAIGAGAWLAVPARRWPRQRAFVLVALGLLALLPAGTVVRDVASPCRTPNDQRFRDFSRWFWVNRAFDAELVCLKTDLGVGVDPLLCVEGDEAMYICYQRMYSPRHARGEPPAWDRVSADRPLRCVRFIAPIVPQDEAVFDRWLAQMQLRWRLVGQETYFFPFFPKRGAPPDYVNRLVIYEFVPAAPAAPQPAPQ